MEACDALVVGGGPAGSSCAGRLQRAGMDVLVLDRRTFPRDKTCAGWVTPPVLETLHFDREDYRRDYVLQPITGFRTGLIGGPDVETQYGEVVSYGIRRCEFDDYLLRRANVRCRLGESFMRMEQDGGAWIVNGEIRTPFVIGAGGHFCPVARRIGNRQNPRSSVVTAQEVEFEIPAGERSGCRIDPEIPELYFCRDLLGYGWCFRKGNYLNIGLGRTKSDELSVHVHEFCQFLRNSGKLRSEIPGRLHGHAYQLYERISPELVSDGVILIGDSAGLAYPQSGEGIRPAVESGLIAADVILQAGGRSSRHRLDSYATQIRERFGTPRAGGTGGWLPAAGLHYLASRLLANRWFSRQVVLDRWFLHRSEPALATSESFPTAVPSPTR